MTGLVGPVFDRPTRRGLTVVSEVIRDPAWFAGDGGRVCGAMDPGSGPG
ncbi:hypothetical protein [Sphingomonas sp. Leaf412]|nr:hypothetical protein [Sphingomonas sp. Leaf412]